MTRIDMKLVRLRRGLVLMEVLFAIMLVATAALIVAATMPVANQSRGRASNLDRAMDLAQKQIEAIRGTGFPNINPTQLAANGLIDSANPITGNIYSFTNSDVANLDNPAAVLKNGAGTVEVDSVNANMVQVIVTV